MGLQLRIRELFAKDETNTAGTEWGSDDMYLGGVTLELRGPDAKSTVHKLPLFKVGTFDDGDRVRYDPPRVFDNYGFGPNVFPKHISVTFLLAEVDKGKTVRNALDDLHRQTEEVAQRLKADMGGGQGGGEDKDKESPWIIVYKVSKEIAKAIYNEWKGDEIFEPQQVEFSIESEAHRWNGSLTSPVQEIQFRGHGGHYILKYDLRMNFTESGT